MVLAAGTLFRQRAVVNEIGIDVNVGGELPAVVFADAVRVRQIVHNLVGNAVKFTTAGRVTIELAVQSMVDDRLAVTI